MTVNEFIQEIRQQLLDTQEPYLWEDTEFQIYLRDVMNEIYQISHYGNFIYTKLTTTANIPDYNIRGEVKRIFDTEQRLLLQYIPYEQYIQLPAQTGKPDSYATFNRRLYLYPTPDKAYSYHIFYQHVPRQLAPTDEILFPDIELLKLGVIYKAYMKQDTEIFDLKALELYKTEYEKKLHWFKTNYIRERTYPQRAPTPFI